MENFSTTISRRRKQLGLSKYRLAKMAEMPYQTLLNIEKGRSVRIDTMSRIADLLGMRLVLIEKES